MDDIAAIRREAAPKGVLRVALNHGNAVLVSRVEDGTPGGVSVMVARAIAGALGVAPEFLHFDRAREVSDGAGADLWDLCFLAVDPKRAEEIAFSPPYVAIEGCYALDVAQTAGTPAEVEAQGLRIGLVRGSAYGLFLTREARGAELVSFETFEAARAAFEAGALDGISGIRQAMERVVRERPGTRLVEEPFMAILQAVGVPAGRPRFAAFVAEEVARLKRSGAVARALAESGQGGVRVPD